MHKNLDKATDALKRMIAAARADLERGRAVDLGHIENVAGAIHRSVAADHKALGDSAGLAQRLDGVLGELGALEADLTRRHRLAMGA